MGRSLLTGGRCSEVAVNTGLTVHTKVCTTNSLRTVKRGYLTEEQEEQLRFKLVIFGSGWLLLTGGHCSEVVVKASLTVVQILKLSNYITNDCEQRQLLRLTSQT